jgi:hypothetical protein
MTERKKASKKKREPEVKKEYIKRILEIEKNHFKKYGYRHMPIEEFRMLFEGRQKSGK